MRVLHVINQLGGGGAEEQLRILLNRMPHGHIRSAVWCGNAGAEKDCLPPEVTLLEAPRRGRWDLRWRALHQFIDDWKPDLLHNWLPATIWTSVVPAKIIGKTPILGAYRNTYSLRSPKRLAQLGGYFFADRIVSNTTSPGLGYSYLFNKKNGLFIPNAVDTKRLRQAPPLDLATFSKNSTETNLLFAGRLVSQKNLKVAVESIALLREKGRMVRLFVCGEGTMRPTLQHLVAEKGLENAIIFRGHTKNLPGVMKSVDALVSPSFREGMPNVVFEAMALELPVIVSDIPAHSQWLMHEENALFFNPSSVTKMAERIEQFLDEPHAATKKRTAAAAEVALHFSPRRMAERYCELYQQMIDAHCSEVKAP